MHNKHLQLSKVVLTITGIWRIKFYENETQFLQSCYNIYSRITKSYFLIMCCSQWLQLFFIATINVDELLENIGVSLFYSVDIVKIWICSGSKATKLINHIYEVENWIFSGSINKYICLVNQICEGSSNIHLYLLTRKHVSSIHRRLCFY